MFTIPCLSCDTCHMLRVTCQVSRYTSSYLSPVTCHMSCHVSHYTCHVSCNFFPFFLIFSSSFYKGVKVVGGGSVINEAQPSSFRTYRFLVKSRSYYTNPVFCVVNLFICYKTYHIFSCFYALSYPKVYIKSNKIKPLNGKLTLNKAPPSLFLKLFFLYLRIA